MMGQKLYVDRAQISCLEQGDTYIVCARVRLYCPFSTSEHEQASFNTGLIQRPVPFRIKNGKERILLYKTQKKDVARSLLWSFILGKGYLVNHNPIFFKFGEKSKGLEFMFE